MNSNRKNAIIVGILILFAYAVLASSVIESKMIVTFAEVLSGFAVIGISIIMFPLFRSHNKKISLWYIIFRFIEGILMVIAGALFMSSNPIFSSIRDGIYVAHTYIFIVAAILFYYLLYISKLIPRWLSAWGFIASILLLIPNLLELTIVTVPTIVAVIGFAPIILNEVFLAIWLIVKGFNSQKKSDITV